MKHVHYLPHTHWDREWLRSSQASRIQLVFLFEELLFLMENDPHFAYFTFDGQSAAVDDYLAICPENKERIQRLVQQHRLFIGPWYTQPDMYLASGESLLRNLLIGTRLAQALGHSMQVGWIPDAFGQIAKTPQLFQALGINTVFAWRGFDDTMINDSLFLWKSSNAQVLAIHFPLGYGYYPKLPLDAAQAYADIKGHLEACEQRFADHEILLMGGSDYAFPQKEAPQILEAIQQKLEKEGYQLRQSNPEAYVQAVCASLKKSKRALQVFEGEARSSALGRIHAGIMSTRVDIKNRMKHYELQLAQVVEPMSCITTYLGKETSQKLLTYFWKILFRNQFHDSAYSSSPESVNQSVENRLLQLRQGIQELIWTDLSYLHDTADLASLKEDEDIVTFFNTLPYTRKQLMFVNMIVKDDCFQVLDENGKELSYVRLREDREVDAEIEYFNGIANFHDGGEIQEKTKKRVQLLMDASLLPPMGYAIWKLRYGNSCSLPIEGDVRKTSDGMENRYLRITIQKNGSLCIRNKESNTDYTDVHYFEEMGDDGDEYNYSPPYHDERILTLQEQPEITCIEESPWLVTYRIQYQLSTPKRVENHKRSAERAHTRILTEVSLAKESHHIRFYTCIENKACDHRIRAVFKDTYRSEANLAQDAFGRMKRCNAIRYQKGLDQGATEEELPIYPMQHYVKLAHPHAAFVLISKGPCEYEIYENQSIALTLLRSVGKFGKADLQVRPGRASGYRLDTPSSQLLKTVCCEYALYIKEDAKPEDIARTCNQILTDIPSRYQNQLVRKENNHLPWKASFLQLSQGLEIMALKRSEDEQAQILRILNTTNDVLEKATITLCTNITHCYISTVSEEQKEEIAIEHGVITLPALKKEAFITLMLTGETLYRKEQ